MGGFSEDNSVHLEDASASEWDEAMADLAGRMATRHTSRPPLQDATNASPLLSLAPARTTEKSIVLLWFTSRAGRIRVGLNRGSYILMSNTVRHMHCRRACRTPNSLAYLCTVTQRNATQVWKSGGKDAASSCISCARITEALKVLNTKQVRGRASPCPSQVPLVPDPAPPRLPPSL